MTDCDDHFLPDGTPVGLELPVLKDIPTCVGAHTGTCANQAAANCSRTACLTHCRALGAVQAQLAPDLDQAVDFIKRHNGNNVTAVIGLGCEMHEEKERLRRERKAEQRKAYSEGRKSRRNAKKRKRGDEEDTSGVGENEEDAVNANKKVVRSALHQQSEGPSEQLLPTQA